MITIFTPAYNRAHTLPKLYDSLQKQTSKDLEWLIVDDGSSDNTAELITNYKSQVTSFPIRYYRQENSGKHTAINKGLELAQGELFFIVDSDDYLTPDAVETICQDWEMVWDKNLCGISYLRGYSDGSVIGNGYPDADHAIANFIDMRYNKGVGGDKAEVWVTKYMRKYQYPVFEGEKFFGESWLWINLARERDMLWRNKIIYITEYLEGGLSLSGRKMRIKNPQGGACNSLNAMDSAFKMSQRVKMCWLYIAYSIFAKKSFSQIMSMPYKSMVLLNFPLGYLLYCYWNYKYNN